MLHLNDFFPVLLSAAMSGILKVRLSVDLNSLIKGNIY